jgi:hypothetical protein
MLMRSVMAALALLVMAMPASARDGRWELLGQKSVGFGVDRDVVTVGAKDGRFTAIQLRVKGNDIELLDIDVIYGNGQRDDLQVRSIIRAGSATRAIDLKGQNRVIDRVVLKYRSRPNFRGQAVVEVWGLEPRLEGRGPGGHSPVFGFRGAPASKWEQLGAQSVDYQVDRDVIRVGRKDGRFKRILLRVEGNDIELVDIKVVYGNGQRDDLSGRRVIRAGGHTGVLDLKGDARVIDRVELVYRSNPNIRGRARVELWGRHE